MKSIPILSLLAATPVWCQSTSETLAPLIVTASPTERTLFDLVQPATVISGHELAAGNQQTLGEILDGQPGVSATQFAPGSSRPIIRGLGDDRVRILQNGTSVLDVSNVSPDHAVSSDLSSASSVEVVRGPATLLYGPNAIGGVVNVIDGRIAEKAMESGDMNGYFDTKYGSADELFSLSGGLNLGAGPLVFHLDAFTKSTENLEIPGYARSSRLRQDDPQPDEARGFLPNSATESTGGAFGASYIWEKGFIGISFSGLDSEYGLVAEEGVFIDLQQRRWDLRGAFYEPAKGLREINYKFSHSDYEHTEFEGAEVGTIFKTDGYNARVEVKHEKIALLEGAVGFEIQNNDFSALGEEAFLPSVENHAQSLFLFEEIDLAPFVLEFGARYDHHTNESELADRSFDAFSVSSGIVYKPTDEYAVSLSVGYSQRPPTSVELFADGLHIATNTFERGDVDLGKESSTSIDLSVRKKSGRVTGNAGVFYYQFKDFISLQDTGVASGEVDEDGNPFNVFGFQADAADFVGGEAEVNFHLLEPVSAPSGEGEQSSRDRLDLILRADYVRAENLDENEPLPRIPPFRSTIALDYQRENFGARLEGQWIADQNRTAEDEVSTDGYFLVDAGVSYDLKLGGVTTTLSLKGVNLLDEEARQHTSFLKEVSTLSGRGVVLGLRSVF